ncbi:MULTISPECIES: DUF2065 domain-containing protein [Mesorhizobium]|uniref:DUF2065 domain-containing protein n=1 Tax=Mesorhizobium denitrificans TaxID=2294114 RepID=A0A371XG37_9HYPH|nr:MULTISPECIES: DUF2065 domain-containing protein [Mesorhizobium]RFC68189.1 DUF2065 domain-containing protein [Mesorhizobium denitrificans]
MEYLFTAVGLVLVFEGLVYGGFPNAAKRLARDMIEMPEPVLRISGIAAMAAGVLIVWLAHG